MTTATVVIHSARLVSDSRCATDAWVAFASARVLAAGVGDSWRGLTDRNTAVTDAGGKFLTPGFIDIHCHGGGGAAFDDGAEAIRTGLAVHRAHGTTRSTLSLVTNTLPRLEQSLKVIAELARVDPLVLGSHLEGPFLDEEFKGAHDKRLLRNATNPEIDRLLDAASGSLRQITMAPELPGAASAITRFTNSGVAVAVGHTAATYEQTMTAFDAGASILTHAFNGMRGIHHRAPGPVVAAMSRSGVTLEIINDGTHVHPDVVRMAWASAPGRVALVTDAMAAAGSADGSYRLGALEVTVRSGVARLVDGGSIAGSTLLLDDAVRRAVGDVGVSLESAIDAVTRVPARALGYSHQLGSLVAGYAADAVMLNEDLAVVAVWANGALLSP